MRRRTIKWSDGIWGALIILLGFSPGCIIGVAYGQPNAKHVISGKVTTEAEMPIPNIQVEIKQGRDEHEVIKETIYTDGNGKYKYSDNFAWPEDTYTVTFTDVDGEENGGDFETKKRTVKILRSELTGGHGAWYEGKATKTVNVTLTEKKEE